MVAIVAAVGAWQQRNHAIAEAQIAERQTGKFLGAEAQRRLTQPIAQETSPLIAALATAGWRLGKTSDAWNAIQRVPLVATLARITHDHVVQAVAFSPDGKFLATASGETFAEAFGGAKGEVRIVAVVDGRELARITHDHQVKAVAFSPDGQSLATASADKTARIVAVVDGRELARISLL